MIIEEIRGDRIYHASDAGWKIRQVETGRIYDDALDIIPCPYTYEETDEPIEQEDQIESEESTGLMQD